MLKSFLMKKDRIGNLLEFFLSAIGLKEDEDEKEFLKKDDFDKLCFRNKFSKYIMPVYYDEEREIYINQDGTIGLFYECIPALFLSDQAVKSLSSIFQLNYPKGTVIQFIFLADPFIDHYLYQFIESKFHAPHFLKKGYFRFAKFYKNINKNIKKILAFPARDYRVFISIKIPVTKELTEQNLIETRTAIEEILKSVKLYPERVDVYNFLFLMRYLLNYIDFDKEIDKIDNSQEEEEFQQILERAKLYYTYIKTRPLNRQIIFADTEISASGDCIKIGKRRYRCLTYNLMPEKIDSFFGNFISGHYDFVDGVSGDMKQVSTPFFIVFNVFCDSINFDIQTKANLILQQQPLGTYFVTLREKTDEYLWAIKEIGNGGKFMRGFLTFWVYGDDEDEVRSSLYKYIRILEDLGGKAQEEKIVTVPLFVYSLPFGGVADKKNFLLLDRDFVMDSETASACAPVQGDFMGTGEPVLLFLGRKGQVIGIDLFSQRSSSYNFFVCAPTGKGKSFFINYLVTNYYGAGSKIRLVDIGGSYKKLAKMFNGKYLEFSPESNISLNPFQNIYDPEYDVPVVVEVIKGMCGAVTGELPREVSEETAHNIVYMSVLEILKWAEAEGIDFKELTVDHVYEVISNFLKYFPDAEKICVKDHCVVDFDKIAAHLAFNLYKFTSAGPYGRWFAGGEPFDISKDDFVVLELEHLKQFPDLFKVVTLSVLNLVTADLYLSDRTRSTLIVMDEAWQFLQDNPVFEKVIEEGYRRARKYRGSFGIVTQDILDFEGFGRVGKVILANSAFKFFLEGVRLDLAKAKNLFVVEDFIIQLAKSIRYNVPKYSELLVITDNFGSGVVRLIVDPYSYFIYTSNPKEVAEIEELAKSYNGDYGKAIEEMCRIYGKIEESPII